MIPLLDVPGAVAAIRDGGLVALPTETVYGLGGDALNSAAVAKIFQAKGRPQFNPIICHLPDAEAVFRYGRKSRVAEALSQFWPGPLTLLLPRLLPEQDQSQAGRVTDDVPAPISNRIPSIVTAGSPFVGFRVPDHPLALEFLRACDTPIAAPSANRSGRRSPTTAAMIQSDYADVDDLDADINANAGAAMIAGILDGGPCDVGVESTVVAILSEDPPLVRILRPGGISREQLESAGFRIDDRAAAPAGGDDSKTADDTEKFLHAPGRLLRHYGPGVPLLLIDSQSTGLEAQAATPGEALAPAIDAALNAINPDNLPLTWLGFAGRPAPVPVQCTIDLSPTGDFAGAARRLFAEFDRVAHAEPTVLIAETLPPRDLGVAVNDRLTRAASRTISLPDEY
ncbi:MAG: L-threonylcarbamoyladenylate synthase [bacterium]|nr:L-threonylcarbamoyladenylate synthase [bacterium]